MQPLTTTSALHKLADLKVDAAFAARVQDFLKPFAAWLPWRAFEGNQLWMHSPPMQLLIKLRRRLIGPEPDYAQKSTWPLLIRQIERNHGPQAAVLFRLLCLSEWVSMQELAALAPAEHFARAIADGLLLEEDGRVLLVVTLYAIDGTYYLINARTLIEHKRELGVTTTHINDQMPSIKRTMQQYLAQRPTPARRILELGCGIGWVSLQLGDAVEREGTDVCLHNLMFARANQALRGDARVRFYYSDLFSEVRDQFSLIVFYPFQPTNHWHHFQVTRGFVRDVRNFLEPDGMIILRVASVYQHGRAATFELLQRELGAAGLAGRFVVRSNYKTPGLLPCRGASLWTEADFFLKPATAASSEKPARLRFNLLAVQSFWYALLSRLRKSTPPAKATDELCASCMHCICPFGRTSGAMREMAAQGAAA